MPATSTNVPASASAVRGELPLAGPQGPRVRLADGRELLNLCGNNYLGFANHPEIVAAAHEALDRFGFGLGSVRFICGTQTIHQELERELADFLGMEDAILYSSCFDANGGLFEPLLGPEDAIFSDELNHASLIDGIRLCKAARYRYRNGDPDDLERRLRAAAPARRKLIVTDGVFSMDGIIAPLPALCELAERYGARLAVDDSHAVGILGETGRGTPEFHRVDGRVQILSGTFGKALGGAGGGYLAADRETVARLRRHSRPYLFSNALSPAVVGAARRALQLVRDGRELRRHLADLATRFRAGLTAAGFTLAGAGHPIVPVMFGEAEPAQRMAEALLRRGILVTPFQAPVVPPGRARIRTQLSAAHCREEIDFAVRAFADAAAELKL